MVTRMYLRGSMVHRSCDRLWQYQLAQHFQYLLIKSSCIVQFLLRKSPLPRIKQLLRYRIRCHRYMVRRSNTYRNRKVMFLLSKHLHWLLWVFDRDRIPWVGKRHIYILRFRCRRVLRLGQLPLLALFCRRYLCIGTLRGSWSPPTICYHIDMSSFG